MDNAFRILHVSDIHFGHCRYSDSARTGTTPNPADQAFDLFVELKRVLLSKSFPPVFDAVMLSGDFTWRGEQGGFEAAEWFSKCLYLHRFCTPGRLFVLPGNHDVVLLHDDDTTPRDLPRYRLEDDYRRFAGRIEGHPAVGHFGYVARFPRVLLVALNSTRLVNRLKKNFGYVGYDQIYALMERAWQHEESTLGGSLRIAALHHHLLPVDDVPIPSARFDLPERDLTITFDAQRTLKALREYHVAVVVHGHMHEPFFHPSEESNPLAQAGRNSRVYVSGAGTVCFTPCNVHQFQVIELQRGKLTIHQFYAEGEADPRDRPWQHLPFERALGPVNEYEPPPQEIGNRRRSEAMQAHSAFEQHESGWDLGAALARDLSADDRLWRRVWKAWHLLYPHSEGPQARAFYKAEMDEMRAGPKQAVSQFRERLGTPEALFAHEYILERMRTRFSRSIRPQ
jgi:3',5'-cyclic AMP phosphodiesterase CpdA